LLAEGLAIAVENVTAAVARLLVIRAVLAATFAVLLAISMLMVFVRPNTRGRRCGIKDRQCQRTQEIAPSTGPTHPMPIHAPLLRCSWSNATPSITITRLRHAIVPRRNAHGSGG
jgi:hypothetical protein